MVIAAAERAGIYIPRFCWHPRMKPVGVCRMCLVDIKGPRGFALQRHLQITTMEKLWEKEGLPGTVTVLHLSGEMDYLLDHEAMRWGRSLAPGDTVHLQAEPPIKAIVKQINTEDNGVGKLTDWHIPVASEAFREAFGGESSSQSANFAASASLGTASMWRWCLRARRAIRYVASAGRSHGRSRSGGIVIGKTFSR